MILKMLPGIGLTVALALLFTLSGPGRQSVRADGVRLRHASAFPSTPPVSVSFHPDAPEAPPPDKHSFAAALDARISAGTGRSALSPTADTASVDPPKPSIAFGAIPISHNSSKAWASLGPDLVSIYPDYSVPLPDKGIVARLVAESFSGKEKVPQSITQYSNFRHRAIRYGVGLNYDWSVDTIIGLSVNRLDAEVTGLGRDDTRRNDVAGYVVDAHFSRYCSSLAFLDGAGWFLDGKAFYGRLGTRGKGGYRGLPWREKRHDSTVYGFSGRIIMPYSMHLDYGKYTYRTETEIGLDYRAVNSDAYHVDWADTKFAADKRRSQSLLIPVRFTVLDDFHPRWGLLTCKLSIGSLLECSRSAVGAEAWNASAGGMAFPDAGRGRIEVRYDRKCPRLLWEAGLGVDIKTNYGWGVRADYRRLFDNDYACDWFRLELAKCF